MPTTERYLEGQHAVVTGASRGIGAAVAAELGRRGASVTMMARNARTLDERAAQLRGDGASVRAIVCDVTDERAVGDAFARAVTAGGPIGVLVNNAGAAEAAKFPDLTRDLWDQLLAVNLTGTFSCTKQVIPSMLAKRAGRVINIASTAGVRGFKNMTAYCATKHGVVGLTRALAMEMAKHGITVNAVCPGWTDTEITDRAVENVVRALGKSFDEARAMIVATIPRGRLTSPEEVARAVSWLCAPESAAVTGIVLPVAGGEVQ